MTKATLPPFINSGFLTAWRPAIGALRAKQATWRSLLPDLAVRCLDLAVECTPGGRKVGMRRPGGPVMFFQA